jgi:predicted DNA-binding ribbon-helix-helix protein
VRKISLTINRHRTSISLEEPFYEALTAMAREKGESVASLVAAIDVKRHDCGLSSAIRVEILAYYRHKALAQGKLGKDYGKRRED